MGKKLSRLMTIMKLLITYFRRAQTNKAKYKQVIMIPSENYDKAKKGCQRALNSRHWEIHKRLQANTAIWSLKQML